MRLLTMSRRRPAGFRAFAVACPLGILLTAGGCSWKQERDQLRAENAKLTEEKQKLSDMLASVRSASDETSATLNEVQNGLEDIRARELKVIESSLHVAHEGKSAGREKVESEIQAIREAVHLNLQKLARLEKANKEGGLKVASLEKLAGELKRSLEEKEAAVAEMESRIGELSKTVESQASSLTQKDETIHSTESELAQKTKQLRTAYVAVASKNVLRDKGVVERKGSILGLGGRWIETGRFDPEVFHEIDITQQLEVPIPAPAGKVRVVTGQPKESYEIVDAGPDAKSSKLAVKDPSAFWKGDRYLVVMVPD
jgi:hypothetical protein